METSNLKNMVVLKNLPSNIVDEAIIVLKANKKTKKLQKIENKKILENQECGITVTDYTSYNESIKAAFIEFVVKDESIIYNIVREVNTPSDIATNTEIPINKDGLYIYHKLIIPTLEYYKAGDLSYNVANKCFYYNQKLYRSDSNITLDQIDTCEKISNVSDMLGLVDSEDVSY